MAEKNPYIYIYPASTTELRTTDIDYCLNQYSVIDNHIVVERQWADALRGR